MGLIGSFPNSERRCEAMAALAELDDLDRASAQLRLALTKMAEGETS